MNHLVLVRHAKAEAPSAGTSDHDRLLTPEGRTSAANIARVLVAAGVRPDVVVVSSARRTVQTWDLMKEAWPEAQVIIEPRVYETHIEGLLEVIAEVPPTATSVMVVGHEPTTSATAAHLAGPGSDTRALQRVAHGLPTGTAAVLETDRSWADLDQRCAVLTQVCAANVQF